MQELHKRKNDLVLKGLSTGLGFYEKQNVLNSAVSDTVLGSKREPRFSIPSSVSDIISSDKAINLEDEKTYERLLFMLEKPWLGEDSTTSSKDSRPEKPSISDSGLQPDIKPAKNTHPIEQTKKGTIQNVDWISRQIDKMPQKQAGKEIILPKHDHFFSLKSFLVDSLISGILFFSPLIAVIIYSGMNWVEILWSIRYQVLAAFVLFSQMYCLLCRLFCFETFGETLTDRRLYTGKNRGSPSPVRMFWRFLLSCATGGISLPVLSFLIKRDVQVYLTGLYFQKPSLIKEEHSQTFERPHN